MEGKFGLERTPGPWDSYVKKYVIIYQGSRNFAGKVTKIEEDYAVLNPFQGGEFDAEKGLIRKLIYKDSIVFLTGCSIEPTTRKSLINACFYSNTHNENSKPGQENSSQ